jgi:hypothetical protein
MTRHRVSKRKKRPARRTRRIRRNGGGWSDLGKGTFNQIAVSPGNQVHVPFSGPGKDCTGNPHSIRPGYIADYSPKGLPGLSGGALSGGALSGGGKRRNKSCGGKRRNKTYGGMAMPPAASIGPVSNPNLLPVAGSVTPKPGDFPDTTGAGGTVAQPNVVMSMPGVPTPPGAAQMPKMPIAELSKSADASNLTQKGGRYGFFPGMGPLNPVNGVGVAPAPFGRIPCETGTYNPLNPNPNDIQRLSTAPLTPPFVTGKLMAGGASPLGASPLGALSSANFPVVRVGDADSMRYYAPTAGYRNDFMTFRAPSPVPGLTIQTPYDAKAFNQACIKTGGSRRNRNRKGKGGAQPVALDAGKFTPVTMNEPWTRRDFDGTNKGLPVKFGGKRRNNRTRRVLKKKNMNSHKKRN